MSIYSAAQQLHARVNALAALAYDDLSETDEVSLTPEQQAELKRAAETHRSGEHALDLERIRAASR